MERGRCFLKESERASAYFSRISYMPFSNLKPFFNALIPSFAFGVFGMTIAIKKLLLSYQNLLSDSLVRLPVAVFRTPSYQMAELMYVVCRTRSISKPWEPRLPIKSIGMWFWYEKAYKTW